MVMSVGSDRLTGKDSRVLGVIPIVDLGKGDRIHLTAHTRTGCGAEHARFIPCVTYYRNFGTHIDMFVETSSSKTNVEIFMEALDKVGTMIETQKQRSSPVRHRRATCGRRHRVYRAHGDRHVHSVRVTSYARLVKLYLNVSGALFMNSIRSATWGVSSETGREQPSRR